MDSTSLWIGPLIERCLSSFDKATGPTDPNLHWEDDGSNIRFTSSTQHVARINFWSEVNALPTANLTDSDIQIDAILSRESLEEYKKASTQPLSKAGCRGYFIQLISFELVYEYSTAQPKAHLYVKRFSMLWERGKTRTPPQGRGVKKKPALWKLMREVFHQIKLKHADRNNSPAYQASDFSQAHPTRIALMSQLPPQPSPKTTAPSPLPNHDAVAPDKLLKHLVPQRPPEDEPSGDKPLNAQSVEPLPANVKAASLRCSPDGVSENGHEHRKTTHVRGTKPPTEAVALVVGEPAGPQLDADHLCPQNQGEEPSTRTSPAPNSPARAALKPSPLNSPVRQHPEFAESGTLRPGNPAKSSAQTIVDPWEGMTEIRSIDVTVPEEQNALLIHGTRRWFPAPPGESLVPGHVPPDLLSQWNKIALQRSLEESQKGSIPLDKESARSTPTSQVNTDSDSDFEWSASPEHGRDPRRQLPADSSPLRGRSASHQIELRQVGRNDYNAGQATTRVSPKSPRDKQQREDRPLPEDEQDLGSLPKQALIQNDMSNNGENAQQTACGEDDEHESDRGSDDSVMDTSIPQPLDSSAQREVSSQLEAELLSSGPSLPESTRRGQGVQVAETPSAFLNKLRPMVPKKDGPGPHNTEQYSSQAGKSSSQSRVVNTYASNEGDTREAPSQESTRSLPVAVTDNPNSHQVIGTPISSGLTQDETPWSLSGSAWTSSGPKSSVPVGNSTYQSLSSNLFSSYREIPPSSVVSVVEDRESASVQGSSQGSPIMSSRVFPSKRAASEIDLDGEASPSKRNKVSHDYEDGKGIDERIIARRQSYIINSAQSVEARRVFEKFRSDYPSYTRDYAHFTRLCSRLQAFRESGSLQRSFLWDDFVIKHSDDYQRYIADCLAKDVKPLEYEEYFSSSFSRPSHKKRSLTADGINLCAAQCISINGATTATSPGPVTDMKSSFTSSLRYQFSNFHAHSFVAPLQDAQSQPLSEYTQPNSEDDAGSQQLTSQYIVPDSAQRNQEIDDDSMEDIQLTRIEHGIEESRQSPATEARVAGITFEVPSGQMDPEDSMEDIPPASIEHGAQGPERPSAVGAPGNRETEASTEDIHEPSSIEHAVEEPGRQSAGKAPAVDMEPKPTSGSAEAEDSMQDDHDSAIIEPSNKDPRLQPEVEATARDAESEVSNEHEEETEESIEVTHQLPTVELGNDEIVPQQAVAVEVPAASSQNVIPESEPEPEPSSREVVVEEEDEEDNDEEEEEEDDKSENWFHSLRHILYPPTPSWSDDPNTPFKVWARADQNVLAERYRRGGAHVIVDEKGVIQPPGYASKSK